MDRLKELQTIVKTVVKRYADYREHELDELDTQVVLDDTHNHYFLQYVGWNDMERIHYCLLHLDIKNGKIWIQRDFIDHGVATDLLEMGVAKSEIVLGFQAPFKRPFTEFSAM
ncbi:MAG: XisI protein [Bacteroidota bacterium]